MAAALSVAEQLAHSTVRLEATTTSGEVSTGTGFFFSFARNGDKSVPAIVTNKHVVKDAKEGRFVLTARGADGGAAIGTTVRVQQYSRGKNRAAKYHIALGSAREMLSCLEVAEAFGYIPPVSAEMREDFDRIIGSLVRLVERSG